MGVLDPEHIPLLSQNQTFSPGRALMMILPNVTKHLSYVCKYVFIYWEQAKSYLYFG